MSLIDTARDAIKNLPISDIVRERLSLALDRLGETEAKNSELQTKNSELQTQVGRMQSDLHRERLDHKETKQQLKRIKDEHAEDIRIHSAIEFRRGERTGGKWMPFCPRCHMPAHDPEVEDWGLACSADCGWQCRITGQAIPGIVTRLG